MLLRQDERGKRDEAMKNKGNLAFLLCLALAAYTQAYSAEYDQNGRLSVLKADLNRDGYFNIVDISLAASAWLEQDCDLSNPCEGADVFPEGGDVNQNSIK